MKRNIKRIGRIRFRNTRDIRNLDFSESRKSFTMDLYYVRSIWFLFPVSAHLRSKNRSAFGHRSAAKIYLVPFQRYVCTWSIPSLSRPLYTIFYVASTKHTGFFL